LQVDEQLIAARRAFVCAARTDQKFVVKRAPKPFKCSTHRRLAHVAAVRGTRYMALVEQCIERLDKTQVKASDMQKLHGLHPKCAFSEWSDPAYRRGRLEQWIVRIGL
jgi:hypothetical protein